MNGKRLLKRARLTKKLFYNLVDNTPELKNHKSIIKFRVKNINTRDNDSICTTFYNSTSIKKVIIKLDLFSARQIFKQGYSNSYYYNRRIKLSFLIGNYKLTRLFVLLHELKHAIDRVNGRLTSYKTDYNDNYNHEVQADNYAIEKLKEYNLL